MDCRGLEDIFMTEHAEEFLDNLDVRAAQSHATAVATEAPQGGLR